MSNVGYDLDTSGGLMPLIRALIKPPDEDLNTQKPKKPQHPYYKRPGKGHNHDSCDACGEGGDLICCDRCPASFHLGCYDPPLDENDIPAGQWLCKECKGAEADKPSSTRSSRAQSPSDSKSDTEKKTRTLRNSAYKKKGKDDKESNGEESTEIKEEKEKEKDLTPMEILVKAAKIMNPKQFELPREMRIPCPFPGTEKEGCKNGGSSLVTVDSWGCVPLPAKSCFVCSGTCKMAPLLQCDYCPLLFHQDCLDPPLTSLPTGRWMCPNHVEQYIDWKLVNSISATERVALWDKFSGPVDQHAIKIDFIRRARTPHPPFRIKVPVGVRGRVVVPGMVRHHYAHPPPLMPSRREYVRCTNVLNMLKASGDYESESESSDTEKHQICLNMSCTKYTGGRCSMSPQPATLRGATEQDAYDDLNAIAQSKVERNTDSSELSDSDFEYLTAPVKRRKVSPHEGKAHKRGKSERLELRNEGDTEELLALAEEQLKKLDERIVKLLAWQRLQQVLVGEQSYGPWRRTPLSARAEAAIVGSIDRSRLSRYGFRHVALPSELLSRAERERIARCVWGAPAAQRAAPASPAHVHSDAPVRAALCCVNRPNSNGLGDGIGRPIPMRLSRLLIGTDSGCDALLDQSRCNQVSRLHATIFYDEVSRHFELINYSEWGSRVNGVLYTCDLSPRDTDQDNEQEADARANVLRDLVGRRQQKPLRLNGSLTTTEIPRPCHCPRTLPPLSAAWEGSAIVPHGALLQFGCLMYVFSITDASVFPYESPIEDPAI